VRRRTEKILALVGSLSVACAPLFYRSDFPRNLGVVVPSQIYRGAQPRETEYEILKNDLNIRTILKLNEDVSSSEAKKCAEYGIVLISVPFAAATIGDAGSCDGIRKAYAVLTDPAARPIYVHCEAGRDRTGFLIGLFRIRDQDWPIDRVFAELRRHGDMLYPHIPSILKDEYGDIRSGTYCSLQMDR
jgi:protein tyrosine/serine phosphatase